MLNRATAPVPPTVSNASWLPVLICLFAACSVVFVLDAAVFRTGLYQYIAEPYSFGGNFDAAVRSERARRLDGRKQILIVGNSRSIALRPRIAEELTGGQEFAFATAAVPASDSRVWYYLLRDVDPKAQRYTAIVIGGLDGYDDEDGFEEFTDRVLDSRMAAGSLGLWDLFDFPFSFRTPQNVRQAFLECLLKGSAYKNDLQGFLAHPKHRWRQAVEFRESAARREWESAGLSATLAGLEVDWNTRKLILPPGADSDTKKTLQQQVETPAFPQTGQRAEFERRWLTRIVDRYKGSRTLLLFLRLPRTPIPRPAALAPARLPGVLRELAQRPNVMLADEHAFESLESPEFFQDWGHLNGQGWNRATRIAVEQLRAALARSANGL